MNPIPVLTVAEEQEDERLPENIEECVPAFLLSFVPHGPGVYHARAIVLLADGTFVLRNLDQLNGKPTVDVLEMGMGLMPGGDELPEGGDEDF